MQHLYDQLIAPVHDLLHLDNEEDRLAIVPTGTLHQIPFHALFDGTKTLGAQVTISVAPSASFARSTSPQRPSNAPVTALVLGVSDLSIPNASNEARRVAAVFPSARLFLDEDATITKLQVFGPTVDLVHLACHGLHRSEHPLFSALRLADGWLTAREIMDMSFEGAVVVLSACETGRHAIDYGEPLGLSWAFLAAGAASVVVSLWTVQDDVTAEMMTAFYDELNAGLDPARALRKAQRSIAARFPHPYHWAPFTVVGAPPLPSTWRS
jgi:CHAT domain-containing protein